jgi:hypothetical protein
MSGDLERVHVVVDGTRHEATWSVDSGVVEVTDPTGRTKAGGADRCRPHVIAKVLLLQLVRERLNAASRSTFTPMLHTITFDECLDLNPSEQVLSQCDWVANVGENEHIPEEAARRLRHSSSLSLVDVRVGMFHMGEYILRAIVQPKDLSRAPRSREEVCDGFVVHYEHA